VPFLAVRAAGWPTEDWRGRCDNCCRLWPKRPFVARCGMQIASHRARSIGFLQFARWACAKVEPAIC
jgi:hypothetical protein